MLSALELENFKAFGQRVRLELAPITLIFGENSAGKSSILQALNLLKQTRESREHGALLLPRAENGIVDLGSFQELLYDHDLTRDLIIRLDLNLEEARRQVSRKGAHRESNLQNNRGVELSFFRPSETDELRLLQLQVFGSAIEEPVVRFEPVELSTKEMRQFLRDEHSMTPGSRPFQLSEIGIAKCIGITDSEAFWQEYYGRCKERVTDILSSMSTIVAHLENSTSQSGLFGTGFEKKEQLASIKDAIGFYSTDFSLHAYIQRMRQSELNSLIAIDGFVPYPLRPRRVSALPELQVARLLSTQARFSREGSFFDVGSFAVETGRLLETALGLLYPMGPYRRPPERWYIFTGTSPQDVGYRGDLLPSLLYRRPDLVQETNNWFDRLQIGYHIDVRAVGERTRDLFEVRLVDNRRTKQVDVALSDVGFGISQILPFIVQSLASERRVITIEQPEVHLHPRLQADIGDLLAEAIREPRFHRFIIETHSEHLVLRMQRLVREKVLSLDEVSILYVSRGPEGAQAQRLRLDEDGEFIDDWPGGFFPERIREIL